ncbi:MAG: RND transporter [Phenylobacterium sp. RIFCSPHIGHO2_01_FULL_69_31]|uniref:efflux RND transporter permease subunit n=1 Tax=Phenylobacterium sp. RIFCSPHIGHO2_01_FULL_69_31 TaxID=1801944 RepID=UPI0008B1D55B|nr:multidrug efflux RND transporter permease subunit [Phenylobacterium sp. RIFCSPHIGHO2_01_FULL_69_31]OHB31348.1 MAG: RND transporter [Phenylobacterium sp. RIFCSPHIGHO2_01_FULL_69_31]
MRFSRFFIDRPVFAAVISVIIILVGAFAYPSLPIAQYPEIAPPTITVTASYPGASAEVIADTVATPLEQEINGVEDMLYMSSSSTSDGLLTITLTFKLGTDLDNAQVLVQNRVASAEPRLPEDVRRLGVVTRKASPDLLMVIHLYSPDGTRSPDYISNYALLQVRDRLARLDGVGDARIFGARDYAMRVWIDPDKAAAHNLTAGEIVGVLRAQNVQVAAGAVGQAPFSAQGSAFELNVNTQGRLTDPAQFADIIVKNDAGGRLVRISDVARVELGAQDYRVNAYLDRGQKAVAIGISQRPGSNALATADTVLKTMEELGPNFPPGLKYTVIYNPTEYVAESINEVRKTLFEAVILVVLVVIVFLQTWRAAIIPVVAIPVSLVGAFAVMAGFGASLNNLSLFGLVLAIGIVVDDAIVVVENVERNLAAGMTPREAAYRTMDEVGGALIAIALVLVAVFVPTAFITGISGQFYKQFAITIASATMISCLVSLTLSPAMAALVLRAHPEHPVPAKGWRRPFQLFGWKFNEVFAKLSDRYGRLTALTVRRGVIMLAVYAVLLLFTVWRFSATPTGFIPAQDQGYFIAVVQLPPGSSLARTDAVVKQVVNTAMDTKGVEHAAAFVGLDGTTFTNAPNAGTIFLPLTPFHERGAEGIKAQAVLDDLRQKLGQIAGANVLVIQPPPVSGIGTGGGWKLMIEDRQGKGYRALEQATVDLMMQGNKQDELTSVFTLFNTSTPRLWAEIDRDKAQMAGVPPEQVFETLSVYLGSAFVNDFNYLGRTYRVTAQADAPYRDEASDIARLQTRSLSGAMVPLGSVATVRDDSGPYRVVRYNLYPAAELQGDTKPAYSSGQALDRVEALAKARLPEGFGYEWTELAYQQKTAGNTGAIAFGLAVVFVFLLLAAQYESVTLPLAIILIVPMCLLAAILGVNLRGFDNNILTQIGLVVLIGLAAKNAILIVEFAKQAEERGLSRWDAAVEAAHTRLRPILMTSFAFILGVLPLVIASGPGAEMRQALGTAVFFGMIGVTAFGLLFTPAFYVMCRFISDRLWKPQECDALKEHPAE